MKNRNLIVIFITIIIGIVLVLYQRFFIIEPKLLTILPETSKNTISSVIVPHFDYFKDKRSELFKQVVKKSNPKTIVLVSVNHFNTGSSNIITTDREWDVSSGKISPNKSLITSLVDSKIAESDETAFVTEHGIKNILSDIKENFPKAALLPIIIKDQTSKEEIKNLSDFISNNCVDCLLVSSVDFSHYCPRAIAKVHDNFSIQALENLNQDNIWNAETDSPQTLYLAMNMAKSKGDNFHLFYNANSGDLTKNDDVEVTSVVMGYYSSQKSNTSYEASTSFVIAGDAMFDRDVWNFYNKKGLKTIFDNFGTRPFRGTDLSLLNLEGPISSSEITETRSREIMSFNFSPLIPSVLNYINVNTVSLANNHTNNARDSGFQNTKGVLEKANINYFGQPVGLNDDSISRIEGPIPISIIGIMALSNFDEQLLESKIKEEKNSNRFVIIYPHWGEEYKAKHVASQTNFASSWIKAGADLIIGSHPHVVEDFDLINNKPVVYSLGNFVFDQYFSQETQEGLVIAGEITNEKIRLSFLPTEQKNIQMSFMTGEKKTEKIGQIFDINNGIGFKKLSSDTIEITR